MKLLFITGHPFLPQLIGGMQRDADQLCRSLIRRGHSVAILAGLMHGGTIGWSSRFKSRINKRFWSCNVARDSTLAYPVWRSWYPIEAVEYVTKTERPDLIVVMAGNPVPMALAAQRTQCPILVELQNVEFQLHGGRFEDLCNVPCVANSRFTAEKYHQTYGVTPTVIYPYIEKVKYKTLTNRENITFINPVLIKGRDIALEIARRCPEIPFCFVESWTLSLEDRQGLMEKLRPLQNVVLHPPQDDMGKVYGKCRVLLAPSIYDEAYGRVATEAQLSGIPVIGSTRGGLPEAVGPGGILIDPSCPIDQWVAAVRRIWKDQAYYAELSAAAQAHAMRSEMCVDHQIAQWQEAFGNAVRSHHKDQSAAQNTQGESFRPLTDGRSA